MRKSLLIALTILLTPTICFAAWDASKPTDSDLLKNSPASIRANWAAIATGTDAALLVTNAKVAAGAAIVDTKLATISTAGKVSGAALTSLTSVPAGAGALPVANGGTGASTRQAAIDGLSATSLTGTAGKALVSDGTNMALAYPASLTVASAATGDVLYYNGTVWTRLGAGTAGQYLKTNGASAPSWGAVNVGIGTSITGSVPIVNGGTGATTAQAAIDALTAVSSATNEHVLTKDTATGNAKFKAPPVSYTPLYVADATKIAPIGHANTERYTDSATYVKLKEFVSNGNGSIFFSIYAKTSAAGGDFSHVQVWKNGSAVGTELNIQTANTYVEFTDTVSGFVVGDLIQIYALKGGNRTYIKDVRLYATGITVNTD